MKQNAYGQLPVSAGHASGSALPRAARGFTLLELMVTVAVLAIVVTVGLPGLFNIVQNNRATSYANELVAAINLARSEAIRRGTNVTVCASADATSCGGGDWAAGWIVIAQNGDVVRVWDEMPGSPDFGAASTSITFLPRGGRDGGVPGETTFNLSLAGANVSRCIRVNPTGRPSVERHACTA